VLSSGHPHLAHLIAVASIDLDPKRVVQTLIRFPMAVVLVKAFVCNHPSAVQVKNGEREREREREKQKEKKREREKELVSG